jgi:NADH:ubiquinone oxidoreductase subunit F (NADH-binding)
VSTGANAGTRPTVTRPAVTRSAADMSVSVRRGATERVLCGISDGPGLAAHLNRWGSVRPHRLVEEIESSGLAGHGGAWFPVGAKWRSVASSRRRPVVVANGAEGEPASRKDEMLLLHAPHLVLDGLVLAARALRARQAVAYVPALSIGAVDQAVAERRGDPIPIHVVRAPERFLAGQESAVVNALNGRRGAAVPTFVGLASVRERGVRGHPTLVHNVETLAHVALIARFGAAWFREAGTADAPGTMVLTVNRAGGQTVVEAALGSSLPQAAGIGSDEVRAARGILLGGYGGGWVTPDVFAGLTLTEKAARRAGATLGAGIVAVLPGDVCPLAEAADVVRYMEGQGAGQCGPCVHGLSELALVLEHLAYRPQRGMRPDSVLELCHLVEGRGACRHPDGVARFVRTTLSVFADELALHARGAPCARVNASRVLPVPNKGRRVSRA